MILIFIVLFLEIGIGRLGTMKASKEFIENLESLTYDPQGFPRNNKELINIQVGTIRNLISILNFQHKVPYVNKEKVIRGQSITS